MQQELDSPIGPNNPTAAVLLIGNELLSGRTRDANLSHLGQRLAELGIHLREARVIADVPERIIASVNELRKDHDYLFTTGGIGPTHDDITADCIADAFEVGLPEHPEAARLLLDYYAGKGIEANADRMRMARVPVGATLVENPVSIAPGFRIENVFVFAGVPRIMQAMLESVVPQLRKGAVFKQVSVKCSLPEGILAAPLRALQNNHAEVEIGSYPGKQFSSKATGPQVELVARGKDPLILEKVHSEMQSMVISLGGEVI